MGKLFQTVGVKQHNMFWPEHVLLNGCINCKQMRLECENYSLRHILFQTFIQHSDYKSVSAKIFEENTFKMAAAGPISDLNITFVRQKRFYVRQGQFHSRHKAKRFLKKIRASRVYVALKTIWSYCTLINIRLMKAHAHQH